MIKPTKRLWRVPLDDAEIARIRGAVVVITDRCKGCGFCVEYCPRNVLQLAKTFNRKGYHPPFVTKPDACLNCNLCEMICPEFAIFSYALVPRALGAAMTEVRP